MTKHTTVEQHMQEKLLQFLKEGGGDSYGLDADKVCRRAATKEVKDGKLVFAIERHRPVAGSQYRPGCPMAAFIETEMTYAYDPESGTLEESAGESRVVIDSYSQLAEDICGDDSVEVETTDSGNHLVHLLCSKESMEVADYEEAKSFIVKIVKELGLDHFFVECEEFLSDEQLQKLKSGMREACIDLLLRRLQYAWDNRDDCE